MTYFSQRLIIHSKLTKQVSHFSELYSNYYAFSQYQQKHGLNIFCTEKLFQHDMQLHQMVDLEL